MAKYLDLAGLQKYHEGIKTKLGNKVDKVSGKGLSTNDYTTTEKNKLKGIATGAEVNTISSIKVNGTVQTPVSKVVDISVPTKTSDLTNDSGFLTSHIDISGKEDNSNKVSAFQSTPDNTHYPTEKLVKDSLDLKLNKALKGVANGVAELDSTGKVPSAQLPAFVDDVLEFDKKSSFPTTGETGKIYVDKETNKTYRWSGSTYVVIGNSLALGETSSTAYRGDRGKTAYDHSQTAHAPSNAERNVIIGVQVNGTDLTATNRKVNINISGKEDKSNKVSSFQTTPDNNHYPTEKLLYDQLATKASSSHIHSYLYKDTSNPMLSSNVKLTFDGADDNPAYIRYNENRGDDVVYEIFSEYNTKPITDAEINALFA